MKAMNNNTGHREVGPNDDDGWMRGNGPKRRCSRRLLGCSFGFFRDDYGQHHHYCRSITLPRWRRRDGARDAYLKPQVWFFSLSLYSFCLSQKGVFFLVFFFSFIFWLKGGGFIPSRLAHQRHLTCGLQPRGINTEPLHYFSAWFFFFCTYRSSFFHFSPLLDAFRFCFVLF